MLEVPAQTQRELGAQIAEKYRIPKLYTSHRELAADPDVDAVVEVTRDDSHAPVSIDILNSGKHLFIEKPLSTNVVDGKQMLEAAEAANVILMVNFMRRYDPGVELANQLVNEFRSSGELGEITFARAHRFGDDWSYYDVNHWLTSVS